MSDPDASLADTGSTDASQPSQLAIEAHFNWLRPFFVGALSIFVLLSVALYNGYPTIFSDTGSYLLAGAFFVAYPPFRAPGYGVFTRVTSMGASPWFTIATQAIIVVYVLYEACDYLIGGNRKFRDRCMLVIVCVLASFTSLSWLVSLLMPDVFAGVLFLCAFLLAFNVELSLPRRIMLAAIMTVSVGSHMSLLPIAVAFVGAVVVLRFVVRQPKVVPSARSVLVWLLAPIIAAGFWTANLNREMGLGFKLEPSGNTFLLGRLFGDGLAAEFLRENCPQRPYIACRYLSDLPQTPEQFLFWHPLINDLKGHEDELDSMARATILAYPMRFMMSSTKGTLLQFASLRTGDEIRTYGAAQWNNIAIQRVFPRDFEEVSNDRQFRGHLLTLANAVGIFDTVIFWLSLAVCLLFARTRRFGRMNQFFYAVIIFLVINASVCATFAGVYDRYQSRVAWLIPFCLTAYVCSLAKDRKRGITPQTALVE